jgi:SOS-response transcriptional repressor LexA
MPVSTLFAREITLALVRLGISQREAAKRTRISPGYISNMCLGQVPSLGKLLQFVSALGLEPGPLMEAAGYPQVALSGQETSELTVRSFEPNASVPVLGLVPGGDWRLAARESTEHYPIHQAYEQITDFCVRVVGESMWPHLQPGDIVGVKAQRTADSGQLVVARFGDEVTIKCWRYERGGWLLAPFNPLYQPITVDMADEDFALLGIVAWHTHDWLVG